MRSTHLARAGRVYRTSHLQQVTIGIRPTWQLTLSAFNDGCHFPPLFNSLVLTVDAPLRA